MTPAGCVEARGASSAEPQAAPPEDGGSLGELAWDAPAVGPEGRGRGAREGRASRGRAELGGRS